MNNIDISRRSIKILSIFSVIVIISCSTLNNLTHTTNSSATEVNQIDKIKTNTVAIKKATNTTEHIETASQVSCIVEDLSFCKLVLELKPFIIANDIDEILNHVILYNCDDKHMELCYGVTNTDCILTGVLGSEGGCATKKEFTEYWPKEVKSPITFRGIIFPSIPNYKDIGKEGMDAYNGPVIVSRPKESDYDWLFFCTNHNDEWLITSIDRILIISEEWLIPNNIIIPWK